MSKGRPSSHYIIERIFVDPHKWGKDDRQDRYFCRNSEDYHGRIGRWGHLYDAAILTSEELNDMNLPLCEGCDVVARQVRLVLQKEHT